jgi:hypothetical protein
LPEEAGTFRLPDIRCEVLVIDCFDMYCHICQAGAKHVNELYQLALERGLTNRVKFIGLGLGDTPLEVATYKEKLKVPFPLFADRKSTVAKQFGPVRLPNLILLRNHGGRLEVIHSSPGALLNPSEMLSRIQSALAGDHPQTRHESAQTAQPTCNSDSACCRKEPATRSAETSPPASGNLNSPSH